MTSRRRDLLAALRRIGIADAEVWIDGVHEPVPAPPEFLFLRRGKTGWETGVCERGRWNVVATFDTESAACDHVLRLASADG